MEFEERGNSEHQEHCCVKDEKKQQRYTSYNLSDRPDLPKGVGWKGKKGKEGPENLQVVIKDTVIEQKSEIILLGVTLDDQLTFSSHVSNICSGSCQTGVILG